MSFHTKTKTNLNGKSPTPTSPSTSGASTSPVTKMRRRRLRTASRSGDDRISFRGTESNLHGRYSYKQETVLIYNFLIQ